MRKYRSFLPDIENKKQNISDSIVFCWLFFQLTTNDFVYRLFPDFFIPSFIMAITPVIVAWSYIFLTIKRKFIIYKDVLSFAFCIVMMLIGAILGNKFLQEIVSSSSFFILITTSIYLYTRKNLARTFVNINKICIFCGILVFVYAVSISKTNYLDIGNSYMAIGYSLSLFSIVLFEYTRIKKEKINAMIATVFSIAILIFGNRGAFFVLIAYFCIRFFLHKGIKISKKGIIIGIILSLIGIITIINFEQIIYVVSNIIQGFGVSSRSLEKLMTHSFAQSIGRNEIYEKIFEIIESNPIAIRGPGYLTTVYISARYTNANAHNIFLELLIEYGCILGPIIFAIILSRICKAVRLLAKSNSMDDSIAACFLIQAIVMLSFSSTFYICNELWLGFVILGIQSRKG